MKTVINIKTEKDVKQSAQALAEKLGLSLSAVINVYLRQLVRDRAVNVSVVPQMSLELEKLLTGFEFDIQRNRNLSEEVSSRADLKKHFHSL